MTALPSDAISIIDQLNTDAQPVALAGHSSRPQACVLPASTSGVTVTNGSAANGGGAGSLLSPRVLADNAYTDVGCVREFRRNQYYGTNLVFRVEFPFAMTALTTAPTFIVFGRYQNDSQWYRLRNLNEGLTSAPAFDAVNMTIDAGTTVRYTIPTKNEIYDMLGFDRFVAYFSASASGNTGGSVNDISLSVQTV